MQSTEFTCLRLKKEILADSVHAIIMYRSMVKECVVKVVNKSEVKTRIIHKTTYDSKGPEVTLRNIWGREGFDVWCNSWEAEINIAKVRLRPNSIRKSQLVEQGITRTRREVHAEDSHKDNSLSEKAAKKSYEAGNCELHKTKFKQLIANAYMIFQRI